MTGQTAVSADQKTDVKLTAAGAPKARATRTPVPPPRDPPPFSVADVRGCIPPHCFERSLLRSFGHVAMDLVKVGVMAAVGVLLYHTPMPVALAAIVWPVFWLAQVRHSVLHYPVHTVVIA